MAKIEKSQISAEVRIMVLREFRSGEPIKTSQLAVEYWRKNIVSAQWFDPEREMSIVISLDVQLRAVSFAIVSLGSLTETIVQPREVFRPAIAHNAYALVLIHNHPSGDPWPSEADRTVTRRLYEAGELLQIKFRDHIIVGQSKHFSFADAGIISGGEISRLYERQFKREKDSTNSRPIRSHRRRRF